MHPEYNKARRKARTQHIRTRYENNPTSNTIYTDAAAYPSAHPKDSEAQTNKRYAVAIVDTKAQEQFTASVRAGTTAAAEIFAVVMALAHAERSQKSATIITDSQEVCRMLLRGHVTKTSHSIIPTKFAHHHLIVWCPGHTGLEGNELADSIARGIINRAESTGTGSHRNNPNPTNAREILAHQRTTRKKYPPPHAQLSGEEAASWRKIQTGVYPHLKLQNAMFPTRYRVDCPWCGGIPTLQHITWDCESHPFDKTRHTMEQWEAQLTSSDLMGQQSFIEQVKRAAEASGALD